MGQQEWEQGKLIELNIGQYRGGFSIGQIPSQINGLSSLETLYLSYNHISSIPPSFWSIESLESLFIAGNNLNSISDSIGLLINLKELGLYSNPIETIPSSIGNLTNMQYLFLFEMELTTIPESLWNLTALVRLDLDFNQLTEIDNAIGKLEFLEELYLTQNNLTELPDSIQYMSNLSSLWIEQNFLYCVDGVQDTSLIPDWLLNNNFLVTGIYEQNCSEMEVVDYVPSKFSMISFPYPFNPSTTIKYDLPTNSETNLTVYNIMGQEVITLINTTKQTGVHTIKWNGTNNFDAPVSSGMYFVRMATQNGAITQKVLLMK